MDAVQNAVQNGIEQLSGSTVSTNGHPGDPYRFQPRTREELLQSQHLAADSGAVGQRAPVQDPARTRLGAPPPEGEEEALNPRPAVAPSPHGDGSSRRLDDGPMPWLL